MAATLPSTTPAIRAGRREWLGLATLCLPVLLVSMDVSILFFAAPDIARHLKPDATQLLWIFDAYGFVLAGLLLTMGALGDRIGRRRLLLIGAVLFGAASALAAWSASPEQLILARGLMGIGGATLMPSTLALIRSLFADEKQRASAIGIWSGLFAGGVGLGPVLAGVLLAHFWWGSVFLVNLPVLAVFLLLGPRLLPESRGTRVPIDVLSALLALGAVLPVITGLKGLAAYGWNRGDVLWLAGGGLVAGLFVLRQQTARHPLVDLALMRRRGVRPAIVVNVSAQLALLGNAIVLTQYLQSVLGMSALRAALWSLLPSVFVGMAAPAAGVLGSRLGRGRVMAAGLVLAAAGFLALRGCGVDSGVWPVLVAASLISVGLVAVLTLVTEAVVGVVPAERAGAASGLLETSSEFGGALGMAILGSIVNLVYRSEMSTAAADLGSHAAPARETLSGAVVVADQVGGAAGAALLGAARAAYVLAMHATGLVVAVLLVGTAVIAWSRVRANNRLEPDAT